MEISWDVQKGSYLPTFLELWINTDKKLDLTLFSKDEMGTFCHEWIHFLQDVTTSSGCNNSYVFFEHFLARGRKLVEDGVEFTPPVNVGNAFNVGINRECNGLAWETTPSSCNFTQINSADVMPAKDISNITVHYQENQDFPVAVVTANNGASFYVGMRVLMESMAHLCQNILCLGTASNHPIYPYHIARLLAETLCPTFLNDPLNLIALCDVSLMSSAPGAYFVSYLKGVSQNRIPMPTRPEDVYDWTYSYPDFLPKFYKIVHYACHHFLGILKDPQVFRFYRYWIKHTYLNAIRLRSKDRYFLLTLLRHGEVSKNPKFVELLQLFSTPLMRNNKDWFGKIPLGNTDGWDVEFLQVIKQIDRIWSNKQKGCALVNWCRSSASHLSKVGVPDCQLCIPDMTCTHNPTLRSLRQPHCPFGLVWYAMGLPLMK